MDSLQLVGQEEELLYNFCSERPGGATSKDLRDHGWNDKVLLQCANALLAKGRLQLSQLGPGMLLYQAQDPQTVAKWQGMSAEHRKVYQEIEKTGDKGCWSKTLKDATNLQTHAITKLTKELIKRQLVKEVKSVAQRGRKVYMVWNIEPSAAVSGGTWYQDGEFAFSWIESLRERCLNYLEANKGKVVTLPDLHAHIQEQPGPSIPTQEEVADIMRTLQLDERIYARETSGMMVYTTRGQGFDLFSGRVPNFMTRMEPPVAASSPPCLLCPLQRECHVGGRICPEKCSYLGTWLRGGWNGTPAAGSSDPMYDVKMNDW